MQGGQITGVVERFILSTTKPIPNMVQRGLQVNVNMQTLTNIQGLVERKVDGAAIKEVELANVAPDVMTKTVQPVREVGIINGWGTTRFRFILVFATQMNDGSVIRSYIQGYSEHGDLSYNNNFDPNMRFFINSIITVRVRKDHATGQIVPSFVSAFNFLQDPMGNVTTEIDNELTQLYFRPQDVISELGIQSTYAVDGNDVAMLSNVASDIPEISRAKNRVQLSHIAEVLTATSMSSAVTDIGYGENDMLMNASAIAADGNTDNIPFIQMLKGQLHTYMTPGSFSMNNLVMMDPSTDSKTVLLKSDGSSASVNVIQEFQTENFAPLAAVSQNAMVASTVAEEAAALAMRNMLTHVVMSITNATGTGEIVTTINGDSVINEFDPVALLERFKNSFILTVFNKITRNGLFSVELLFDIDIYGSCFISVKVEGEPRETYTIPTYADSLHTSLVMNKPTFDASVGAYSQLISLVAN